MGPQQQQNPLIPPGQMPPPPPPSPALGFQIWASDQQNALKVQPSMIPPDAPLQPGASAQPPQGVPMASSTPPMPSVAGLSNPPNVTLAPPTSFQSDLSANPNKYAQPIVRGKGTAILNAIVAGLQGASGGLKGDPSAGVRYAQETRQHDEGLPAQNQALYESTVLNPYNAEVKRGQDERLGAANLAHVRAETGAIGDNLDIKRATQAAGLAQHGLRAVDDGKGGVAYVPDESSPIYQKQQLSNQLAQATIELRKAQSAFEQSRNDPNSEQSKLATERLRIASQNSDRLTGMMSAMQERADAQLMNAKAGTMGVDMAGNPLPGAMLTDEGQTVGSHFQSNVRPTGQQRGKGNMAESAAQQIDDLKDIVAKRPDVFGPAAGRKTDFTVWLGSQDPDAQRFRAARTIAGDHLAGTFGGRSETALRELDSAIGHFKDNPAAVTAGLNQLKEANQVFLKAGKVRTVGSSGNPMQPPSGGGNQPKVKTFNPKTGRLE